MAFSGNALCTSFKKELMLGVHNFTTASNVFKLALYDNSAVPSDMGGSGSTMNGSVTTYATNNEISSSGGSNYTAGGQLLTSVTPTTSGTTALTDFADEVFSNVTISSVRGALIYNSNPVSGGGTPAVCVLDFGSDKSASSGDFTIVFPTPDASNAIIRIA
tara:strand:- start:263 stop:745 length:483 start_codon:yes stop_codon:yes gene_type:complete